MLNNTSATAAIANATASISNFKSDIFGGLLALSGDVSTTEDTPKFHMNVSLEKVKIEDTFKDMERSEEHTSELQSRGHLVCRLLLEKKKLINNILLNTRE